ncbi:MAG: YhjD/YihY/BrkB family envelope integrity protein [Pseudomonadota bacterium]
MFKQIITRLREVYQRAIWRTALGRLSWPRRTAVNAVRIIQAITLEMAKGDLTLRAMSLVYTTLLSLVPLLAVSFSVLKAFGVHNQVEPLLLNVLSPLGEKGPEFTQRIIDFVENVEVGVLGSLGLAMLIYTVVSLVQKIESAFNFIWHIDQPRRLVRRFSDYMSVILVGPVLVFSALGITAAVMGTDLVQRLVAVEPIGTLVAIAGAVLPYVLVCAAFTFIYLFIPNTKVNFSAAFTGGLIAGVLWETGGWLFAAFVASSTQYTAIYSGFAILITFMIWLYLSWLIVLLGAQIAYYQQHPAFLNTRHDKQPLSNQERERLAILLMLMIGYNYYYNRGPWTLERLAQILSIAPRSLQYPLGILERQGFISRTGDAPPGYYPARDIETISLREVLAAVRHGDDSAEAAWNDRAELEQIATVMRRVDAAIGEALAEQTIKDLLRAQPRSQNNEAWPAPSDQRSGHGAVMK